MKHKAAVIAIAILLAACSKPTETIIPSDMAKWDTELAPQMKKLSEEDRADLTGYLMRMKMLEAFDKTAGGVPLGTTVGDAISAQKKWKADAAAAKAAQDVIDKKRKEDADALSAKVAAERKAIEDRISAAVTIAITDKKVLPEDMSNSRFYDFLVLTYAIENKSDKGIVQLKGTFYFKDATGDEVGMLPVTFDQAIAAGKTLKTDTGRGWNVKSYGPKDLKDIARHDLATMTVKFVPSSIAFAGGEVLKAPE